MRLCTLSVPQNAPVIANQILGNCIIDSDVQKIFVNQLSWQRKRQKKLHSPNRLHYYDISIKVAFVLDDAY